MSCRFFKNSFYTIVGGISVIDMNRLELDLLFNLDFMLKVKLETFGKLEKYATASPERVPVHQAGAPKLRQSSCPRM
jgi:hypothetical protein